MLGRLERRIVDQTVNQRRAISVQEVDRAHQALLGAALRKELRLRSGELPAQGLVAAKFEGVVSQEEIAEVLERLGL